MIEGLKPYAEYKESGLPWLGRCPRHWNVRRTKILFHERVQKGFPNEPLLAATQTKGVVKKEDYETRTVTAQKDLHLLKLVEVGDYVISLRSFQGGIEVAHCRGIISPAYTVLKPQKQAVSRYYSHFFKAKPFIDSLSLFVTGIREGQNIDYERLSRAEMPMPPKDEQAAIVRFLDHANRKIDGWVRAKRKLIGLLNEQKQAIIHRAVTRGLYPDVLLKPSGIPWLGDIPTHWDTPLLGRCLTHIEQGWSPVGAEGELGERQWCVLTLSAVRRGVFDPEAIKPVSKSADIPRDIEVANGDLLLTRSNTRDRVGDVCLVKDVRHRTLLCDLIYRLTLRKGAFVPQFLVYQLLCPLGRGQIEKDARGSSGTMPKISQSHIKAWRVLLPPPEEQQAIVELIEIESGPIDTAIARTEREIALMQEYRTRLTADLVTGKLDVREAAANLPEAPAEPAAEEVLEEELLEETEPEEAE
jgi:type I restriction enzyme S subunit